MPRRFGRELIWNETHRVGVVHCKRYAYELHELAGRHVWVCRLQLVHQVIPRLLQFHAVPCVKKMDTYSELDTSTICESGATSSCWRCQPWVGLHAARWGSTELACHVLLVEAAECRPPQLVTGTAEVEANCLGAVLHIPNCPRFKPLSLTAITSHALYR